jgi:ABC-type dipeptide/oligopeptide/nickel transport system permease component
MGLTFMTALVTLLSSLITDLLYTAADPRISFNLSQK